MEGWARKPVNHTNRKDVVCCHLIDRPQSVPQLSCNRTLQFLKILRVNRNAIYSLSSKCNAVMPLYNLNVTCKVIFARSCPRLHSLCSEWEGGPVKRVNHTSWVVVVTPTDRPKSVRNHCVIELFCGVVCVVTFCWCGGFCYRTESDLFLFLLEI